MSHAAVILLYHRIAVTPVDPFELSVRPQRFAEQLEALRREMRPLPLPDLLRRLREGSLPRAAVAITFDDGYADVLTQALPLLEQFEIPATLFVVSGAIGAGRGFWWDELSGAVLEPDALPEELPSHGRSKGIPMARPLPSKSSAQSERSASAPVPGSLETPASATGNGAATCAGCTCGVGRGRWSGAGQSPASHLHRTPATRRA